MFKVGSIVADLELRKQKWDNSIRSIKADEDSLKGFAMRNSQAFTQMGMAMTLAGAAIVGSVGLMVKAYSDFDQALT